MYKLKVKKHFDSAHFLRGYRGKCSNLHGHSWSYEIVIEGKELDDIGILVDFKMLKEILEEEIESLFDHTCLNDVININPTAENLSKLIFDLLQSNFIILTERLIILKEVTVWESPECSVTYRPDEE
jgi:6-pyruvoyltetrahydropterin/6-carboxytetrahydropterin synthase